MKKTTITFLFLLFSLGNLSAQWVSPGTGNIYSMEDLASVSGGCVESIDESTFRITSDITIATNDQLTIENGTSAVIINDQILITINGSFKCQQQIDFYGEGEDHFGLRFENATDCQLNNIRFKNGTGFHVIESEVVFENCHFEAFTTQTTNAAVNYMNCSPTFSNCTFTDNYGAAISSGVNVKGSPLIKDCYFFNNVVSNQNLPQINLGPGDTDTIRIIGNQIIGNHYSMSGGIAVTDLIGTGSTIVLLKDNEIKDNRYGYNQQGFTISSLVIGNLIIDNNAETNPMNGGSGISIYGYNENMKAKLRNNIITGNLWGITAIYYNDIDLGTEDDYGNNSIFGNHNDGYGEDAEFGIYNNSHSDITAIGNYWGTNNETEVEDVIYHHPDLGDGYGTVTFLPILVEEPTQVSQYDEKEGTTLTVFPIPCHNEITIESPFSTSVLTLFNSTGQPVYKQQIRMGTQQIELPELQSGIYFVVLDSCGMSIRKKIVITPQ